jgi:hypothetical protein
VKIWRIYRLPGSRTVWHIDMGPDTQVLNVTDFICRVDIKSVDIGDGFPRAWMQIDRETSQLHLVSGVAVFDFNIDVTEKIICAIKEIREGKE